MFRPRLLAWQGVDFTMDRTTVVMTKWAAYLAAHFLCCLTCYLQNRHHGRLWASFKAVWANKLWSWSICWSLAAN